MPNPVIDNLIASQKPGHALQQGFYKEADVFAREFDDIFLKSWLFVGHRSQLPEIGSFIVFDFAAESLIIVRSSENDIKALLNVCRHRGSRVCIEAEGVASQFVCPYHAWTYETDGRLRAAPSFGTGLDSVEYGLKEAQLIDFHGLLFMNFDKDADFHPIARDLEDCIRPYGIANTKIAKRQSYPIASNWKLAVENFNECYHCLPAHREFSVGHGQARGEEKVVDLREQVLARADSCGLSAKIVDASWSRSEAVGAERYFDRYPMLKGHVTGSRTGRPVAPLLGSIRDYDGGASDFQIGPLFYMLAYCDHTVIYRFLPVDKDNTHCELVWLVNETAVEGRDYDIDELTWLWDVTTIADKRIIEDNRKGVDSRFFEPGPLAPRESWLKDFVKWYLRILARE